MPANSRISDIGVGICCCHLECIGMTGMLVTGSHNVTVEDSPQSRLTDIVLGFCGHVGIMVTGSPDTDINGMAESRVTDVFTGCFTGILVTGASTVNTNG